jgi:hypothetical protein
VGWVCLSVSTEPAPLPLAAPDLDVKAAIAWARATRTDSAATAPSLPSPVVCGRTWPPWRVSPRANSSGKPGWTRPRTLPSTRSDIYGRYDWEDGLHRAGAVHGLPRTRRREASPVRKPAYSVTLAGGPRAAAAPPFLVLHGARTDHRSAKHADRRAAPRHIDQPGRLCRTGAGHGFDLTTGRTSAAVQQSDCSSTTFTGPDRAHGERGRIGQSSVNRRRQQVLKGGLHAVGVVRGRAVRRGRRYPIDTVPL